MYANILESLSISIVLIAKYMKIGMNRKSICAPNRNLAIMKKSILKISKIILELLKYLIKLLVKNFDFAHSIPTANIICQKNTLNTPK